MFDKSFMFDIIELAFPLIPMLLKDYCSLQMFLFSKIDLLLLFLFLILLSLLTLNAKV